MGKLVVKARLMTCAGSPVFWESPAHAIDGTAPVGEVAARFRGLYAAERVVGFTFLDPELVVNAPEL
jgi:hypothetical protein